MSQIVALDDLDTVEHIEALAPEEVYYRLVLIGSSPLDLGRYLLEYGERSHKMRTFRRLIRCGSKLWAIPPYYVVNFCLLLNKPLYIIIRYITRFPEIEAQNHHTFCLCAQQGRLDYFIWSNTIRPIQYRDDYWLNAQQSKNPQLIKFITTLPRISVFRETIEMVQLLH